jgi:glucan phosphoethanolaminetransferase (alkaline phosphatase superfamily)
MKNVLVFLITNCIVYDVRVSQKQRKYFRFHLKLYKRKLTFRVLISCGNTNTSHARKSLLEHSPTFPLLFLPFLVLIFSIIGSISCFSSLSILTAWFVSYVFMSFFIFFFSMTNNRSNVNISLLQRNIRFVAEALCKYIYGVAPEVTKANKRNE